MSGLLGAGLLGRLRLAARLGLLVLRGRLQETSEGFVEGDGLAGLGLVRVSHCVSDDSEACARATSAVAKILWNYIADDWDITTTDLARDLLSAAKEAGKPAS